MAEKYTTIFRLAQETEKRIISSGEEWINFLWSAGHFSKYAFDEQVLIHAQRPQAVACASINVWNSMGCWINKGAKGIALLDTSSPRPKLKYVFDMSDVEPVKERNGHLPYLWHVGKEHEQTVINALETAYKETDSQYPFIERIAELLIEIGKGYYVQAAQEIMLHAEGSMLEGMDNHTLSIQVYDTMVTSALCLVSSACGWEPEQAGYFFPYIHKFNTPDVLHLLGEAVNEMTRPVIREISRAVHSYDLQAQKTANLNFKQKMLANGSKEYYNALKRESIDEKAENKETEERGESYGTDLQMERELPDTRHWNGKSAGRGNKQVWQDEVEILKRTQKSGVYDTSPDGQTGETSSGDSTAGRGENGTHHGKDRTDAGRKRGAESTGSDALGTEDERNTPRSGGKRFDRNDFYVNNDIIQKPDSGKLSGFSVQGNPDLKEQNTIKQESYQQINLFSDIGEPVWKPENKSDSLGYVHSRIVLVPDEQIETGGETADEKNKIETHVTNIKKAESNIQNSIDEKADHLVPDADIDRKNFTMDDNADIANSELSSGTAVNITLERPDKKRDPHETAHNFHISFHNSDDKESRPGPKERFLRNVAAIRLLKKIESENRAALPQEQEILHGYTGWGGLADAFDKNKPKWAAEYQELKILLTPQEYDSARESILNAHYTRSDVIHSIYVVLENLGFAGGNLLEPSLGTGNFFGLLPESMKKSSLYGVELDGITGRIAKLLYPEASIRVTGFENADYPDNFFDVVVGNVPFGDYKVNDHRYDRLNFMVHDYFFAKSVDKVRTGGVVALITSNGMGGGTLDKRDSRARRYMAERCDLLGAIRLPSGIFDAKDMATDILFLQKRETLRNLSADLPEWVQTTVIHENTHTQKDGRIRHQVLSTNNYYITHPDMVLGRQEIVSGPFGPQFACHLDENFKEKMETAVKRICGSIVPVAVQQMETAMDIENGTIPADPAVRNFSYSIRKGEIYFRENSIMRPVNVPQKTEQRIRGMVQVRDCVFDLIHMQLDDFSEESIKNKQSDLNVIYDTFTRKYGYLNSAANKRAFRQDAGYSLLCSLEKIDEHGKITGKADMFTKRTIKKSMAVTHVDTAGEALMVSLNEKSRVDAEYMSKLTGKQWKDLVNDLTGIIFKNPENGKWETADSYLSGNVRQKFSIAKKCAQDHPEYKVNAEALEKVQPKLLDASEIEVRIGATWIDSKYIEDFMREVFETPAYLFKQKEVGVEYIEVSGLWYVRGKTADRENVHANTTYGTGRANAYKILEESLNLRDIRIFDTVVMDGKEKRILNKKETLLACQKQDAIRETFREWIFKDQTRRQVLCAKYNELFNSTRTREYDGSHLIFPGMTPDITLRPHQLNAVAHQLYGKNTLLAHCVGAGKTFEMIAAAMEGRRVGLWQKSLFVVPNHLTEQWAADFLRLYPGAKILAATKKDFEPENRKKFCSRIATGDYEAVIIGHSQFESTTCC